MIRTRTLALYVAFVLAACVLVSNAQAGTGTVTRYRRVSGTAHVTRVRIPTRCIDAEDSASHVYLYAYGNGVAVYHCRHKGY